MLTGCAPGIPGIPNANANGNTNENTNGNVNNNTNANTNTNTNTNGGMTGDPTPVNTLSFSGESGLATPFVLKIESADLDGDGDNDIVSSTEGGAAEGEVLIITNDATCGFGTMTVIADAALIGQTSNIEIADVDGDNDLDIVIADSGDHDGVALQEAGGLLVILNNNGAFAPATAERIATSMDRPGDVEVGDVNGDGLVDLVTTSIVDPDMTFDVLIGAGDGTFAAPITADLPANAGGIALADMDQDGVLDLVFTLTSDAEGSGLNEAGVLFGAGDGSFGNLIRLDTGVAPKDIEVADLNADGALDILVGNLLDRVSIFLGNGDGAFGEVQFVTDAPGGFFRIADIDGDGDPDIIAKGIGGGIPVILYNDGSAAFPEIQNFSLGETTSVAEFDIIDLDGDDRPDLAATGTLIEINGVEINSFPIFTVLQTNGN
jgi:hypothetical protein